MKRERDSQHGERRQQGQIVGTLHAGGQLEQAFQRPVEQDEQPDDQRGGQPGVAAANELHAVAEAEIEGYGGIDDERAPISEVSSACRGT